MAITCVITRSHGYHDAWMHADLLVLFSDLHSKGARAFKSMLARPQVISNYENDADSYGVAAAYAEALKPDHAFADGNKRIAFDSTRAFLPMNDATPRVQSAPESQNSKRITQVFARQALSELRQSRASVPHWVFLPMALE